MIQKWSIMKKNNDSREGPPLPPSPPPPPPPPLPPRSPPPQAPALPLTEGEDLLNIDINAEEEMWDMNEYTESLNKSKFNSAPALLSKPKKKEAKKKVGFKNVEVII